ncbi:MAG: MFS transporter [Verrucomicrobia bacterium]|nr:MFS transporter [Verrucomicrobiota bacterium]MBU6445765.1 MFS transporter [Verrucomicrobiota bacterium]MDE3047579.1 MFS transporter [Verrucomicrobiota bacterium]
MGKNFAILNTVQFIDALVENLFKYIVIYFLIYYKGHENSSNIMATTGAVFITPFILFSSVGGFFADRWSKSKIVQITRIISILFLSSALMFVIFHEGNLIYLILFMVASVAAIFGPSKYGIVPELVPKAKLVSANGYLAAFTFFGIIAGTGLASWLDAITGENFTWMVLACMALAFCGALLSFTLSSTEASAPHKAWPPFIYKEIFDGLREMASIPQMWTAVFAYGYFVFVGGFVQMNVIPYTVETLHLEPIVGGYLFLVSSIGVGIGSMIAPKLTGTLKSIPWTGAGMSIGCFLFTLFSHPYWLNLIWLVLLGVIGGLFLVPSQAYIMAHSQPESKGRNFGTAGFFSYVFALLAAGVLYVFNTLIGLTPAVSFTWIGIVNLGVSVVLYFLIKR